MSFSIQTNVNSLLAQDNLRVNQNFQTQTIQRLTSGYRINSSADDAAGLSIANQFHSDSTELTQGVRNANDGVSQLQIVDGGLGNIAKMLDRMKTLATQSASSTFTGNRATLDTEYQQLLNEITRQSSDVGLNSGGLMNKSLSVYIGGSRTSTQAGSGTVSIDLSKGAVDAASLGLSATNVSGGSSGVDFGLGGGGFRLDNPAALFVVGGAQAFTFNYTDGSGNVQQKVVSVAGGAGGITGTAVIDALNSSLAGTGITASIETGTTNTGQLQFSGTTAFTVYAAAETGVFGIATGFTSVVNNAEYSVTHAAASVAGVTNEVFTVSDGTNYRTVTLTNADTTTAAMVTDINTQLANGLGPDNATAAKVGVTAMLSANGTSISFQSSKEFSITESAHPPVGGVFGALGNQAVTAASSSATAGTAAGAAITAINAAVTALGIVQGVVGSGQNKLNYAINLAQSQITNFDAAESRIRDADVAQEASNLTKAQVLQQASIAAMSQANSAPQAVLALLRG